MVDYLRKLQQSPTWRVVRRAASLRINQRRSAVLTAGALSEYPECVPCASRHGVLHEPKGKEQFRNASHSGAWPARLAFLFTSLRIDAVFKGSFDGSLPSARRLALAPELAAFGGRATGFGTCQAIRCGHTLLNSLSRRRP